MQYGFEKWLSDLLGSLSTDNEHLVWVLRKYESSDYEDGNNCSIISLDPLTPVE
jgi:hypothetical protein